MTVDEKLRTATHDELLADVKRKLRQLHELGHRYELVLARAEFTISR